MRILGHLDRFGPPAGGGVITTVAILRELARRGHEVCVVTNRPVSTHVTDVRFLPSPPSQRLTLIYASADIVIPHMVTIQDAIRYAPDAGVPVVYPVYDDGQLELYGLTPDDVALVVFCATGLKERSCWPGRATIVYPPIHVSDHRVERTGDRIAISSLSREKGGELFWELVDRMPDRRFLAVVGGWGDQLIPNMVPANVELMQHQGTDLRNVFRKTRILLAPSQRLGEGPRYWTENWGRAAIEAACSGIPTIATPAPGPLEALGEAGIFRDRGDLDAWITAIEELDDSAVYQHYSNRARERARELEVIVARQIDELACELVRIRRQSRSEQVVTMDDADVSGHG